MTKIDSISGLLPANAALITTRPFRSPHHPVSDAGFIAGGLISKRALAGLAPCLEENRSDLCPDYRALCRIRQAAPPKREEFRLLGKKISAGSRTFP